MFSYYFVVYVLVSEPHLKLLLSFAVGGLLGDVFLHLLPEAWMYVGNGKLSFSLYSIYIILFIKFNSF